MRISWTFPCPIPRVSGEIISRCLSSPSRFSRFRSPGNHRKAPAPPPPVPLTRQQSNKTTSVSNGDRHPADQPAERTSDDLHLNAEATSPAALAVPSETLVLPRETMARQRPSAGPHVPHKSSTGAVTSEDTLPVGRRRTPSNVSALNEGTEKEKEKENANERMLLSEVPVKGPMASRVRPLPSGVRVLPDPVSQPNDNDEEIDEDERSPSTGDHPTSSSASTPTRTVTEF